MKTIGTVIKEIRKSRGLSLADVADKVDGYDAGNLSRFERSIQGVTTEKLENICNVLEISVSDLYAEVEGLAKRSSENTSTIRQEIVQYENVKDFQKYVDKLITKKEIDQVHELLAHFVVLPKEDKQEILTIVNRIYKLEMALKQVARQHGRKPDWSKLNESEKQRNTT